MEAYADWCREKRRYREAERVLALLLPEPAGAASPKRALLLNKRGLVERDLGELGRAATTFGESVGILKAALPGSGPLGDALTYAGDIAWKTGRLNEAEAMHTEALGIRQRLEPEGLKTAASLNNLGIIAWERGDAVQSEILQLNSLHIKEKYSKSNIGIASSLNNLAVLYKERGNLAAAEEFLRRSIAIREALSPDSPSLATYLINLGNLLGIRQNFRDALVHCERALSILSRNPGAELEKARCLGNIGVLHAQEKRWESAEESLLGALEIYERVAPESPDLGGFWLNLGLLAELRGDADIALDWLYMARDRYNRIAPAGSWSLCCDVEIARLLHGRGRTEEAVALLEGAVADLARIAPGSHYEADAQYRLGSILRESGRGAQARFHLCRAMEAIEQQSGMLGGSQVQRSVFAAERGAYHQAYARLLLERGEPSEALAVLERSRGRVLLEMLAERDLVLGGEGGEEADGRRRILSTERARLHREMTELSPERDRSELAKILQRLDELDAEEVAIREALRASNPRLAALRYPQPLGAEEIRRLLEPGTLLLCFGVCPEETLLLLMKREWQSPRIIRIPVARESLGAQIRRFLKVIEDRMPAHALGDALGDLLLGEAGEAIGESERLLILPDGPLHSLPFGALRVEVTDGRRGFLVERLPVGTALSATVLAEVARAPEAGSASPGVALAVPEAVPGIPGATALPGALEEVRRLSEAFRGDVRVLVGAEATVAEVERIRDARFVHFACHGLVDSVSPLDSALVLGGRGTPGGDDNPVGSLLFAWEVFERVRIRAPLVTLGACRSARGEEMGGEGLMGLSRAFHFAGARCILAALWSVADQPTAEMMGEFYRLYGGGRPLDDSLAEAQRKMIRDATAAMPPSWNPDEPVTTAHPYYWAGFTLSGGR